MKITTIMFDLDGTLLPMDQEKFTKLYFKLLAQKLEKHGYSSEKLIQAIWTGTMLMIKNNGLKTNEQVFWDFFVKELGEKVLAEQPIFEEFYNNEFQQTKEACGYNQDAVETVKLLKSKGYRLVLATNPIFPQIATKSRILWAGLSPDDFELYTTYENSSFCKPNPKYYQNLLEQLGLKPEECIMVGNDVVEDAEAASQIGMSTFLIENCLINSQQKEIKAPSGNFADLLNYLKVYSEKK